MTSNDPTGPASWWSTGQLIGERLVMEAVVSSTALGHVGRVLQRSIGRLPLQHVSVLARADGLEFLHDDGVVETLVRLEADVDVDGEMLLALRARVLVDLLRRLPRGQVMLSCDGAEFRVAISTLSYGLIADLAPRRPPAFPTGGVRVDEESFLEAFRRVVRASDQSQSDIPLVRIAPLGADLRLDCHGFDRSASDVLPGRAGTFGDRPAVIELGSLTGVVSRFDGHRGALTIARTSEPERTWFIGRRRNSPVSFAASTALSAATALDATDLMGQPRPHRLSIQGSVLRGALKRCALAQRFESVGGYVAFRLDGNATCELLAQGGFASMSETVRCAYVGPPTELTLRGVDLAAAVWRLKGRVVIAFADNAHSVLIGDGEHFRCFIRPLPPAVDGGPQYREQPQHVPFPERAIRD